MQSATRPLVHGDHDPGARVRPRRRTSWTAPSDPKGGPFRARRTLAKYEGIHTFRTHVSRRAARPAPARARDGAARAEDLSRRARSLVGARRPDRRGLTPTEVRLRPQPALRRRRAVRRNACTSSTWRCAAASMAPNSMAVLWMLSSSAVGGGSPFEPGEELVDDLLVPLEATLSGGTPRSPAPAGGEAVDAHLRSRPTAMAPPSHSAR